jgi:outer membrane usher protein
MRRDPARPGSPLRAAARALPVALALALAPAGAGAQDRSQQDIFRQVFGNRGQAPQQAAPRALEIPVLVDGREVGTVRAQVGSDPGQTAVAPDRLAELLEPLAQPALVEAIRSAPAPGGLAPVRDLAASGIGLAYDPGDLALKATLRPEQRRAQAIDFSPAPRPGSTVIGPAFLSAYANLRATTGHQSLAGEEDGEGRLPLRLSLENYVNLDGWVLEADAFFQEDGQSRWRRGDVRVVRDLPEESLRLAAGDVGYPVAGFQAGRPLGGFAVARDFLLQPYRNFQPSGQQEFVLTETSTVEVEVNGRPTRSFRLAPGPYSVLNFPGTSGTNDVRIRITDAFGREQVIEFPFFFDRQLLAPGVHEFAYAAGVPSTLRDDRYVYDGDRPTVSGLHRIGVTDWLTLGLNVQADPEFRQVGAEALLATRLGTFSLEPAVTDATGSGTDFAGALRFRDYRSGVDFWERRTVTAQAVWRGEDFGSLGSLRPSNPVEWDLSARIGQPVARNVTLTLGGRHQISREPGASDATSLELSARSRILDGVDFDVSLSRERDRTGEEQTLLFAGLRILFADGRHSAAFSYDSPDEVRRAQWRYQDIEPVDAFSASLELSRGRDGGEVLGDVAYVHDRFAATARHDRIERLGSPGRDRGFDRRTTLTASTALAFADGHVGVSRPITDGFAIVAPHPRLAGRRVGVDRVGDGYLASGDALGPPVVPNLSAYRQRSVLLDVPDAPSGYDLGEDRPTLLPGYRSGVVVPLGTDAAASLTGVLRGPDGAPLSLHSGELRPAAGGDALPFFTNRGGRFVIDGVRPGRWLLALPALGRTVEVEVPPDAEGTVNLGAVAP